MAKENQMVIDLSVFFRKLRKVTKEDDYLSVECYVKKAFRAMEEELTKTSELRIWRKDGDPTKVD